MLQHVLAKYGRLEWLRPHCRAKARLQLIHRRPEGSASLKGDGVGSLDADRRGRRRMDWKRHWGWVAVDVMMACRAVLACMTGMHRDGELQVRAANRCSRCWYRWVRLHRRDLRLRDGAREVVRERRPLLVETTWIHTRNHVHDVRNVRSRGDEVISIVG
jgi:hypothetical protein